MRKLILTAALALGSMVAMNAQTLVPADCQNSGYLAAQINNCEAQGWKVNLISTTPINYLVQPDPPYVSEYVDISYVRDCEPLEPCPEILKVQRYERVVINNNGNCRYRRGEF